MAEREAATASVSLDRFSVGFIVVVVYLILIVLPCSFYAGWCGWSVDGVEIRAQGKVKWSFF